MEQYGLVVDHVQNGQVGLQMIQDGETGLYQAVLMDIQMPVMNGYEATRAIRALDVEYCRTVPPYRRTRTASNPFVVRLAGAPWVTIARGTNVARKERT